MHQAFVKEQFRQDARVGAAKDDDEWVLTRSEFAPTRQRFVGMAFFVSDETRVTSQDRESAGGRQCFCLLRPGAGPKARNTTAAAPQRSRMGWFFMTQQDLR